MVAIEEQSDEAVAETVQSGNKEAFGELMRRYEAKLKRYGRKFLARPEEVDDLVQDVFIKAYEHIQSFNTKLKFSPWIYRIAHNTFINELKRRNKYGLAVFDPDVVLPLLPAKEKTDQSTLDDEWQAELDTLVESLSAKYREIIILHYFEDLSYREISDILRIPVTTVGVRMTRARDQLRKLYQQKQTNHE